MSRYLNQTKKETDSSYTSATVAHDRERSTKQDVASTQSAATHPQSHDTALVGKQITLMTLVYMALNSTILFGSLRLVRFLAERNLFTNGVIPLFQAIVWLVGLAGMVAFSYLVGRYTSPGARRAGILVSNAVYCICFYIYQYAVNPAYLRHLTPMQWVYQIFMTLTGIVTQIAIAEFVARRNHR